MVSVACSRNAEMYEIAYRQAVKDYEKVQKQVNALEEEAVKALTGESQLDLKVVNTMLLKHREKLETAQREMEETRNRVEQEDQNKKAPRRRSMSYAPGARFTTDWLNGLMLRKATRSQSSTGFPSSSS